MITIDDIRVSQFIRDNQERLKNVFEEAMLDNRVFDSGNSIWIARKGYKLQRTYIEDFGFLYEAFATHSSDYYKWVKLTELGMFEEWGFNRAVDCLLVHRLEKKINFLTRKIRKAGDNRNDSLVVHWRRKRKELIERKTRVEEVLQIAD